MHSRSFRAARLSAIALVLLSCTPERALVPDRGSIALEASAAAAAAGQIVISQIYGGGGNSGATYKNDFIELFNAGTAPVSVSGWSVQYASVNGTSWQVTRLGGTIEPGRYYLVREAPGAGGTTELPTADTAGAIPMAAGAGKVVLAAQTAAFTEACPLTNVIDRVGYGATNCATTWGPNAPGLTNTTAALRGDDGCAITASAAADFTAGAPAPRNSRSSPHPCQPVEVASVVISPASATITDGETQRFTAQALDADGRVVGAALGWSSTNTGVATIGIDGLATGRGPGDAEIIVTAGARADTASLHVNEAPLPDLPATRFSELHYDNVGTDVGEAIEIEGPAGASLAGWSVVLYNGVGGGAYDVRPLHETIPDLCGGRGVVVLRYEQDGIQNGSADGLALVDADGGVVEFLSYEGVLTATDGPAAGRQSTDIGVSESSAPHFQTLQRRPTGRWDAAPEPSTLGGCYGSTPVTPVNQLSFSGRTKTDAALPVGFEDQVFATLRAPSDATIPTTVTWESLTPDVATIDRDGVLHALAAGTVAFRATASDGTTATYSLPTIVATPSTTAQYGNNAEFGEPTDADASDDYIVRRREYTSSFNRLRNIPNWVSYDLDASHIVSGQDRCDCFTYDPELPSDFQRYTTADYTGAGAVAGFGIDRGHLARSFDRTSGTLDNAHTFYFSNIVPQAADNNQGPWAHFENYLGALAQNENKEVYIIAGASGSQGTVKNEGVITIPEWTWKVAVILPRDRGLASIGRTEDLEVLAVIMPNRPGIRSVPNDNNDWKKFATTVNAVEALSGYDVLALLPDRIETVVEAGMQDEMALVDGLVDAGTLARGNGNSLVVKLEAAAASLDAGNRTAAENQLEAMLNEVDALGRSRRLDGPSADALRQAITALIASLN